MTDALKYLHSGEMESNIHKYLDISVSSKQEIIKFIAGVVKRMNKEVPLDLVEDEEEEIPENDESPTKKLKSVNDFLDSINKLVNESMRPKKDEGRTTAFGNYNEVKTEIRLFELSETLQRGKNLEFAYQSLLSVTPTSVESERAFSSAGLFCTKIRSRLSDKNLSTLLFLRAYFKTNNCKQC